MFSSLFHLKPNQISESPCLSNVLVVLLLPQVQPKFVQLLSYQSHNLVETKYLQRPLQSPNGVISITHQVLNSIQGWPLDQFLCCVYTHSYYWFTFKGVMRSAPLPAGPRIWPATGLAVAPLKYNQYGNLREPVKHVNNCLSEPYFTKQIGIYVVNAHKQWQLNLWVEQWNCMNLKVNFTQKVGCQWSFHEFHIWVKHDRILLPH